MGQPIHDLHRNQAADRFRSLVRGLAKHQTSDDAIIQAMAQVLVESMLFKGDAAAAAAFLRQLATQTERDHGSNRNRVHADG